ncbi:hypothetical protein V9T40_014752 [Parthenolecanium corni]|uniref:Uncharacterized protein n=1 Tax=Parthenolecanium corni TaxID=536013 RepID=A0AAN9T382_9HEMI
MTRMIIGPNGVPAVDVSPILAKTYPEKMAFSLFSQEICEIMLAVVLRIVERAPCIVLPTRKCCNHHEKRSIQPTPEAKLASFEPPKATDRSL